MSMITLNGTLFNVYKQPTRRDGEEGEKPKIQVMGDIPQTNGEIRKELVTISVPDIREYEGREGEHVSVPVGAFAPSKGQVIFFAMKA